MLLAALIFVFFAMFAVGITMTVLGILEMLFQVPQPQTRNEQSIIGPRTLDVDIARRTTTQPALSQSA